MKLHSFFLSVLFLSNSFTLARAGENPVSIFDTRNWTIYPMDNSNNIYDYYEIIPKDTIIKGLGRVYKRLYHISSSTPYCGALREDGHRVYFVPSGEKREYLLYDFGLELGESVDVGLNGESHVVTVVGIDSICVNYTMRRRLRMEDETLRNRHWAWPAYWIEGIGSDLGILSPYGWGDPGLKARMHFFNGMTPVSYLYEEIGTFHMLDGFPIWMFRQYYSMKEKNFIRFYKLNVLSEDDVFTIGGKSYQKLTMITTDWDGQTGQSVNTESTMGIREEDGRVYVNFDDYIRFLNETKAGDPNYIPYPITDENEIVLYDFNMKEGDTYRHVDGHDDISVVGVSCSEWDNYRRMIKLSNGRVIEEGRGCTTSFGTLVTYLNPTKDPSGDSYAIVSIVGYGKNGIYLNNLYESPILSFTDGITTPEKPRSQRIGEGIYDLQGRKVKTPQKNGLYIKNGKKFIAR